MLMIIVFLKNCEEELKSKILYLGILTSEESNNGILQMFFFMCCDKKSNSKVLFYVLCDK